VPRRSPRDASAPTPLHGGSRPRRPRREAQALAADGLGARLRDLATSRRERIEQRLLLRHDEVETVVNQGARLADVRARQQRRRDVGEARAVGLPRAPGGGLVALHPLPECLAIVIEGEGAEPARQAPGVGEPPRLARDRGRLGNGEEHIAGVGLADGRLPQRLFLGRREQDREPRGVAGIERVAVGTLDEGGKRQDVCGGPGGFAGRGLARVVLARQVRREPAIRGDDRAPRFDPLR
jgi:hypothetical protein